MSALTDVLRDPMLQEQNMSPMATPPILPTRKRKKAAAPMVNPMSDPWSTLGAGLGNMAVNKWGQKDAMGEVMPGQSPGGLLVDYLKRKF